MVLKRKSINHAGLEIKDCVGEGVTAHHDSSRWISRTKSRLTGFLSAGGIWRQLLDRRGITGGSPLSSTAVYWISLLQFTLVSQKPGESTQLPPQQTGQLLFWLTFADPTWMLMWQESCDITDGTKTVILIRSWNPF